nr:uncharacterized protein LOC117982544 [Maniola hyperantus]
MPDQSREYLAVVKDDIRGGDAPYTRVNPARNSVDEVRVTIYKAVIEPTIMYSSSTWAPAAEKITTQKKLRTVQRGFAQKICKSYRTVSYNAAVVLAGLIPLDARVREAAQLYEAKRGRPPSMLANKEIENRVCFLLAPHPAKEPNIEFSCLEDMEELTVAANGITGLNIFTDGSKTDDEVGAALTCWEDREETHKKKFRLEAYCTVFQAELYALFQATEYAFKTTGNQVNIFSDSRSSLELLKNMQVFHPLGFAIKNNLIKLEEIGKLVKLFWIRAHVGVPGNERADMLAKEAANESRTQADYDKCPVSYIKKVIRKETINRWNQKYIEGETASITKVYFPTVELAYKFTKRKLLCMPLWNAPDTEEHGKTYSK